MALILVHPPSDQDAGMFDAPEDDPGHAPWIAVRNLIRSQGGDISTTYLRPQDIASADWVCFMNLPDALRPKPFSIRRILSQLSSQFKPKSNELDVWKILNSLNRQAHAALFLWEPEVVEPDNYLVSVHKKFAKVFTWDKRLILSGGVYRSIVWPQASNIHMPKGLPFIDRKLLVNFSGNKKSDHPLELYSSRLEVIRYMERNYPEKFDHFGPGWTKDFLSWRGVAPSKHDLYPLYRYGLCYENMQCVNGYITEKVFDCIRAGAVPVYWGASDICEVLPEQCFIDRRNFKSISELIDFLLSQTEFDWLAQRQAGHAFINGEVFRQFLPEAFAFQFYNGLVK